MWSTRSHAAVFFICPIGNPDSLLRHRADVLAEQVCEPVAAYRRCNFFRADRLIEPGLIIEQIIMNLLAADFVVADLAGGNPNVMYELAIRHATGKPCVCLKQPGEKTPYDIAPLRVLDVSESDADSLVETRNSLIEITRQIDESGVGPKSPNSEALGPWRLRADIFGIASSDLEPVFKHYAALRVTLVQIREVERSGNAIGPVLNDMAREIDYLEGTIESLTKKSGYPSPKSYVQMAAVYRGVKLM